MVGQDIFSHKNIHTVTQEFHFWKTSKDVTLKCIRDCIHEDVNVIMSRFGENDLINSGSNMFTVDGSVITWKMLVKK